MMNTDLLIAGLAGLLSGLAGMWFFMRHRSDRLGHRINELERLLAVEKERTDSRNTRIADLEKRVTELQDNEDTLHKQSMADKSRIAELQTRLDNEQRSMQEKLVLLEQAEKNMTSAFENLANRIVEEKSKKFTEQNKLNIGEVLNPLREQLGDFRKKIEDVY
ncbi:MAG TPA: hypothetical protein VJ981_02995, partial [Gammaproteobacteria bacterium]|nr:hypothetical protein [Gammaproteobacteria bacterium]